MNKERLAEFTGIMLGDGNITFKKGIKYRFVITGHSIDDYHYLKYYVSDLIFDIFNKKPSIWNHKNKNAIALALHSKEIISFLINNLKLKYGVKMDLTVPGFIFNGSRNLKSCFLRGIADTDFSVTFKKKQRKNHSYPVIHGFSNSSKLIEQIKIMLMDFGIKSNIYERKVFLNGMKKGYQLDIYGHNNFSKWLFLIGFNNNKHLSKIKIWEKNGFYIPPNR